MIDNLFTAALTFCLLAVGTTLMTFSMLGQPPASQEARVVQLERVVVVARRAASAGPVANAEAAEPAPRVVQ